MRLRRKAKERGEGGQNQSAQSVIGFWLARRAKQRSAAYFFLLFSLVLYWYVSALSIIQVRTEVICFILALIVALFVGQKALEYRIKKRLYGTNEYEAREILEFMLSNAHKSDFTSGKGFKGLFPESKVKPTDSAEVLTDVRGAET